MVIQENMPEKMISIGAHFYDPPRRAYHQEFENISTDPKGEDWTRIVANRCYDAIGRLGILNLISYDINGVLLQELKRRECPSAEAFTKNKERQAIGTSFIHPILPDLNNDDKQIVIGAGRIQHRRDFGVDPKIFWPPETAMDKQTAEVLADYGYKAFICAPDQLRLPDRSHPNNQVVKIPLSRERDILAIPFDRGISNQLAFGDKSNADRFARTIISPEFDRLGNRDKAVIVSWTDGETFGQHWPWGDKFLSYLLLHSLPEMNIKPVLVNDIDLSKPLNGELVDRTAWSCRHGNLARWNSGCDCDEKADNRWKTPYYKAFNTFNEDITRVVKDGMGDGYVEALTEQFESGYVNAGPPFTDPEKSLIAAKVASLISRTSCATFFKEPHTSGHINIMFALVAITHLRDAGLKKEAEQIEDQLVKNLRDIPDPYNKNGSIWTIAENFINQREINKDTKLKDPETFFA